MTVRGRALPIRTCVGCRARAPKPDLVRIVRSPTGEVGLDRSGSAPGRGAFVHRDTACAQAALRGGALARALRTGLGENELGKLRNDVKEYLEAP